MKARYKILSVLLSAAIIGSGGAAAAHCHNCEIQEEKIFKTNKNTNRFEGWSAYTNKKYGFEIGYPAGSSFEEAGDSEYMEFKTVFKDAQGKHIASIGVTPENRIESLREYIDVISQDYKAINDGISAVIIEGTKKSDGSRIFIYAIRKEGRIYCLEGIGYRFTLMISTFKLIEPEPAPQPEPEPSPEPEFTE